MTDTDKIEKPEETYVYNGKEVFITGRTASKPRRRGADKILHEVLPVKFYKTEPSHYVKADWVEMKDLFIITEDDIID